MILDWLMPGMDGVDLCSRLRTLEKDVSPYIILLTGLANRKDLLHGFNVGADDYVIKPFDPEELRVRIGAGERIVLLQIESLAARDALRKTGELRLFDGVAESGIDSRRTPAGAGKVPATWPFCERGHGRCRSFQTHQRCLWPPGWRPRPGGNRQTHGLRGPLL